MKQMPHICGTTLYNGIFFECNVSNNDDELETRDVFYGIPLIKSLNMILLNNSLTLVTT